MADKSLQGTMSGMDVTGADAYNDLPPEARAAAMRLLSISSAPNQSDYDAAHQLAAAAYAPLLEQVQGMQAPTPETVDTADPLHTFAALLAANLAGSVNPAAAQPTYQKLASQREEQQNVAKENRMTQRQFEKERTDQGLQIASQITSDALKAAQDAGDDKAATEKALQLARINDALERRKQKEHDLRAKNATTNAHLMDPEDLDAAIQDVIERGDDALKSYPVYYRTQIGTGVRNAGYKIMPTKVRNAINEVGQALKAIQEIRAISLQVNTARAGLMSRGMKGVKNIKEALEQSGPAAELETTVGGLSGNLSRSVGAERGVLTDQDRKFVLRMMPNLFTTGELAQKQLDRAERFLQNKTETAERAYTAPNAGLQNKGTGGGPKATHRFNPATGKVEEIK